MKFSVILLGAAIGAVAGCGSDSSERLPNAGAAIEKCRDAYAALKSYQGTTESESHIDLEAGSNSFKTKAAIKFVAPDKLRVEGDFMGSGTGTYVMVASGGKAWVSGLPAQKEATTPEMAIAGLTGVSGQSATTIPAILLHTSWGDPFGRMEGAKVTRDAVAGVDCYKLTASDDQGTRILWIDVKTNLLVQLDDDRSLEGVGKGKTRMHTEQRFKEVRINAAIPPDAFAPPSESK